MSAFSPQEQKHLKEAAYSEFLRAKIKLAQRKGFDVPLADIHPGLKPHTRDIVRWALAGGQRAIFASFGLHKTSTNLEVMRQIGIHRPGLRLIVLPLGVRQEFIREAAKRFTGEYEVQVRFIRTDAEIDGQDVVYLTNYESVREGKIDVRKFRAVGLDEASVLRSYGSKTYQEFLPLFEQVEFKFVYTATPSPNRFKELIHYAGFLGVMDTGQALTRFFQRDSEKAGNLTLYPHKEQEFWLWVASWAVFIQRPSDLGHSDEGYDLPALDVRFHEVPSNYDTAGAEKNGQGLLIPNVAMGLSAAAGEKRDSMAARVAKVAEIMAADPDDHFLIWHDLEDERHAIQAAVPGVISVWGTQDLDQREQRIADFSDGKIKYLSTKPIIAGSGCNFQVHCHREIFGGIGFKFNDFIQAVHRVQRFQQQHPVRIDIIHTEVERKVLADLMEKWRRHDEMQETMGKIIRNYGLDQLSMQDSLARTIGVERAVVAGERFSVANNDCVLEAMQQPDNSVGMIITSVPFANHYEYTPSYNDFGHTQDNDHFWAQMDFLTPELLRILQPGRIYACHVKDRINFGNVTGAGVPTVSPFHAEALFHGIKHGFDYMGMITVVTDVVRENNQTYRLGYSEVCKDGTKMGVGSPEYILLFHKPQTDRSRGYADTPVTKAKPLCLDDAGDRIPFDRKAAPIPGTGYSVARWQVDAHAFWRSSGDRLLGAAELASFGPGKLAKLFTSMSLANVYNYEYHVEVGEALLSGKALPADYLSLAPGSADPAVWHDIVRMRTLNGEQSARAVEKHVCPFQIDIVDRLIGRYTNPGEVIYDPFCGLGTVPVRAMKLGREGRGSELNPAYFADQVHYCQAMEREVSMPTLFDMELMDQENEK
ncbi:MAG: DNA methyltransferase [Janthinobacterium svalbardensis]